jgi:hypothetical protein
VVHSFAVGKQDTLGETELHSFAVGKHDTLGATVLIRSSEQNLTVNESRGGDRSLNKARTRRRTPMVD